MNERFLELAVQAGEEAVKSVPFFRTGRCQIPSWVNVFIEVRDKKFAELIIRECSAVADNWVNNEDNGKNLVSDKLKEHFGVE
jgi:hypothetical protein